MVIPPKAGFHCRYTVGSGSDGYASNILFLKREVNLVFFKTSTVNTTPMCSQVYHAFE